MPITQNGKYQLVIVASDKAIMSQVVIDFEISSKALFNGDGPIINFINNNFEMIIGVQHWSSRQFILLFFFVEEENS